MTEVVEDTENLMPTERKSFWRSAEERRMSDLTRVLEWLERRQGQKRALQVCMMGEFAGRLCKITNRKESWNSTLPNKGQSCFKHWSKLVGKP